MTSLLLTTVRAYELGNGVCLQVTGADKQGISPEIDDNHSMLGDVYLSVDNLPMSHMTLYYILR